MRASDRIPALDGWRAVAILAVILSHAFILRDPPTRALRAVSYSAGHLGGLGVALFFAISGYLITSLLLEEHKSAGRISLRGFYTRRAFRILPAAYLYLATLCAVSAGGWLAERLHPGEIASAVLLFNNYWADRSWYTSHFWSLSMEEHFYLFWPAALACLGLRRAGWLAVALIALNALWRPWSLAHISLPVPALQRTDMRLDAFLFACALAIALHGEHRARILRFLTNRWFQWPAAIALIVTWAWGAAHSAPSTETLVQSALLPPLLVSVVFRPVSWPHRILETAPLRWIGRISYGLYLWQQLFLHAGSESMLAGAAQALIPHAAMIFAAATLSYYGMERRLLDYGRRLSRKWTHGAATQHEPMAMRAGTGRV
jgi:peptidoglycan/LPS O-acetylase OafA/YrhL